MPEGPVPRVRPAPPLPGLTLTRAIAATVKGRLAMEWLGSAPHRLAVAFPAPQGLAARPKTIRPVRREVGERILAGRWSFFGEAIHLAPGGDPWDRPSPSKRFAEALHGFAWMPDLLAHGEAGAREGLRLALDWRRIFGRWNAFSWAGGPLERRVFHLACALPTLAKPASEAEAAALAGDLARQARHLLDAGGAPDRAVERAAAAALAGATLGGKAGEAILARALRRLERALPAAVLPDGGHATRTPERTLDLLFDLMTLDDALSQRGRPAPPEASRAIDRMFTALRFYTLADGRLPSMQGGEAARAADITAALAADDGAGRTPQSLPDTGYYRMEQGPLQVLADAGPPAAGPWSASALAQPLALEIVAGGRRLITNMGWSPRAAAPQALRLTDGGSTCSLGDTSAGEPLRGFRAEALGAQLVGAPRRVTVEKHEGDEGVWLDLAHDGWLARHGLWHERRLFLSAAGELRGEDRFTPAKEGDPMGPRRYVPFTVRFHLAPDVSASVARDKRSVLLRAGSDAGWWLRNDAADVVVEPSWHYEDGEERRCDQIVLKGQVRADQGGRVRWKLTAAEGA